MDKLVSPIGHDFGFVDDVGEYRLRLVTHGRTFKRKCQQFALSMMCGLPIPNCLAKALVARLQYFEKDRSQSQFLAVSNDRDNSYHLGFFWKEVTDFLGIAQPPERPKRVFRQFFGIFSHDRYRSKTGKGCTKENARDPP
jgi:hypothetical protein